MKHIQSRQHYLKKKVCVCGGDSEHLADKINTLQICFSNRLPGFIPDTTENPYSPALNFITKVVHMHGMA